ncbi:MAG: ATP synthase F1 subunit delta [Candidatus Hydrogenedentes bacterium]|nr:ATP synthase F1 subunit delta [Candidatus Hydrogenedentota bacterium]
MKNFLIAQRYARALSAVIVDDNEVEVALDRVTAVAELFQQHHDFRSCLNNPAIQASLRLEVLDDVAKRLGASVPVVRLFHLMLENDRISLLTAVSAALEQEVDRRLNRVTATVTTAAPLDDGQMDQVRQCLAQHVGKTVRTKPEIKPAVLGGVVARLGGKVLDGSVRTRLAKLRESLIAQEISMDIPH